MPTKSGYSGLLRQFTTETTFLGAHVIPQYLEDRSGYVDLVTGPMLQAAAPYARWIDVFCEPHSTHAFDAEEAREVLKAGAARGLGPARPRQPAGSGVLVFSWRSSTARPASITAPTLAMPTSMHWAAAADTTVATLLPGVEFCPGRPIPMPTGCSTVGASIALATDCNLRDLLFELDAVE